MRIVIHVENHVNYIHEYSASFSRELRKLHDVNDNRFSEKRAFQIMIDIMRYCILLYMFNYIMV